MTTKVTELSDMSDEEILDYCDWLIDNDPITLLREVIPFLISERSRHDVG